MDEKDAQRITLSSYSDLSNELYHSRGDSLEGPAKLPPTAKVAPLLGTHPLRQATPSLGTQKFHLPKSPARNGGGGGGGESHAEKLKHLMALVSEKSTIIEK